VVESGWGDRGLAQGRRNQAGPKKHNAIFLFIKKIKRLELIWSKDILLVLQKFWIKYWYVGNWIRNNLSYWNFSKFGIEFELKIKEALGLEIQ
jgi:hypothetical protein